MVGPNLGFRVAGGLEVQGLGFIGFRVGSSSVD